jgi:uncharacterized protein (UPF0264 family)
MPGLLVSVRNAAEASAALEGGADLIDIKEPAHGPLGAADVCMWQAVIDAVAGRAPVSAALGELVEQAWPELIPHTRGLTFVKAGLSHCAASFNWRAAYAQLRAELPEGVTLVAVAYADHELAAAPSIDEVLAAAIELRLPALLIDTFDKTHGTLWTWLSLVTLPEHIERAQSAGVQIALAGSLSLEDFPMAAALHPDWLAVRGAACEGGRLRSVVARKVRELKEIVTQLPLTAHRQPALGIR